MIGLRPPHWRCYHCATQGWRCYHICHPCWCYFCSFLCSLCCLNYTDPYYTPVDTPLPPVMPPLHAEFNHLLPASSTTTTSHPTQTSWMMTVLMPSPTLILRILPPCSLALQTMSPALVPSATPSPHPCGASRIYYLIVPASSPTLSTLTLMFVLPIMSTPLSLAGAQCLSNWLGFGHMVHLTTTWPGYLPPLHQSSSPLWPRLYHSC